VIGKDGRWYPDPEEKTALTEEEIRLLWEIRNYGKK